MSNIKNEEFKTHLEDDLNISKDYKFGFHTDVENIKELTFGLTKEKVIEISTYKNEPSWMLEIRLKAFDYFVSASLPDFGPSLEQIDLTKVKFFASASEKTSRTWDDVPEKIKQTFDAIGVPKSEQEYLSGLTAQFDSEAVYHASKTELEKQGVIFFDMDTALKNYPDLVRQYFGKLVSYQDNKFAALNTAVWSGGSFIYVPKGVKVDKAMQSYFRINTQALGQFERTLIIIDEGADVSYIEGCTAPLFDEQNLHAAVVELFIKKDAKFRYTTIQNWSDNVNNLVTKRAICEENAHMEWIDGNIGSGITMKYPAVILKGDRSSAMSMSIALASRNQKQDVGAKMIHLGKNTKSNVISKSISRTGGAVNYRGLVKIAKQAINATAHIECDTLILDNMSTSDTIPYNEVYNSSSYVEHEAKVSKISEEQLFYLMSRGLDEQQATELIILGFIDEFTKELPMEYAIELNRLIKYEFDGTLG